MKTLLRSSQIASAVVGSDKVEKQHIVITIWDWRMVLAVAVDLIVLLFFVLSIIRAIK